MFSQPRCGDNNTDFHVACTPKPVMSLTSVNLNARLRGRTKKAFLVFQYFVVKPTKVAGDTPQKTRAAQLPTPSLSGFQDRSSSSTNRKRTGSESSSTNRERRCSEEEAEERLQRTEREDDLEKSLKNLVATLPFETSNSPPPPPPRSEQV